MAPLNRSVCRNVSLVDAATNKVLGGFHQSGGITEKNLRQILRILLVCNTSITITNEESGAGVGEEDDVLALGRYLISNDDGAPITVSNELYTPRTLSFSVSGREGTGFRDDVRERDGGCVITGTRNKRAARGIWNGFQAAHVFPVALEQIFVGTEDYQRWVTNPPEGRAKINSPQNGLLMGDNLHSEFDAYLFSINPDDNFKVVTFCEDNYNIEGKILDPVCRQPGDVKAVSENLLRWHFRQAVLANVREAGEPVFEFDFPPGTDMLGEIRSGPDAAVRMEMELQARLGGLAITSL